MRGNTSAGDLAPLDLEIEASCRRNNAERRRKILQDKTAQPSLEEAQSSESSSIFPEIRESEVGALEANIMADEQPHILLRTILAPPCCNSSQALRSRMFKPITSHILIP